VAATVTGPFRGRSTTCREVFDYGRDRTSAVSIFDEDLTNFALLCFVESLHKKPVMANAKLQIRDLLAILAETSALISDSPDLSKTLDSLVEILANRMGLGVCSIYMLDQRSNRLILSATVGLDQEAVGKYSLMVGEGLPGLVIDRMKPIVVVDAMLHPRYKYFPEACEDRLQSFLGVPLIKNKIPIGVLTIQTRDRHEFGRDEVRFLVTISSQVVSIIVQKHLADTLKAKKQERKAYQKRVNDEALARRACSAKQTSNTVLKGPLGGMQKIFISYAKEDREHARKLYERLRAESFDPWLDEESLLVGQDWQYYIPAEIEKSDFFIALLSTRSAEKTGYVQKEIRKALAHLEKLPPGKIFVLPVRVEECQVFHPALEALHYVNMFPTEDDWQKGFQQICSAILSKK
jgi:putative methionine-R-sulfoxide reductase with GAF domain